MLLVTGAFLMSLGIGLRCLVDNNGQPHTALGEAIFGSSRDLFLVRLDRRLFIPTVGNFGQGGFVDRQSFCVRG